MNFYLNGLNNHTLKRSNAFSNGYVMKHMTPSGSHTYATFFFYKDVIPSGFFAKSPIATSKRSNIYRQSVSIYDTTPMGSNTHISFFFYKHLIPFGLTIIQKDNVT